MTVPELLPIIAIFGAGWVAGWFSAWFVGALQEAVPQ